MICKEISLQTAGSQPGSGAALYLLKDMPLIKKRPLVVVCPGGAYAFCNVREGEPLALQFMSQGYHAAVVEYSTDPARFPTAVTELALLFKTLRENAEEWHIDPERIFICGSSAGGHLAASYGALWHEKWLAESVGCDSQMLRPQGMILSYPVITGMEGSHEDSFRYLLGDRYEELRRELSIETRITENAPPTFVWHTGEDTCVPVINSMKLVSALLSAGRPVEFHLFPKGAHGLALADKRTLWEDGTGEQAEAAHWMSLCLRWLKTQI